MKRTHFLALGLLSLGATAGVWAGIHRGPITLDDILSQHMTVIETNPATASELQAAVAFSDILPLKIWCDAKDASVGFGESSSVGLKLDLGDIDAVFGTQYAPLWSEYQRLNAEDQALQQEFDAMYVNDPQYQALSAREQTLQDDYYNAQTDADRARIKQELNDAHALAAARRRQLTGGYDDYFSWPKYIAHKSAWENLFQRYANQKTARGFKGPECDYIYSPCYTENGVSGPLNDQYLVQLRGVVERVRVKDPQFMTKMNQACSERNPGNTCRAKVPFTYDAGLLQVCTSGTDLFIEVACECECGALDKGRQIPGMWANPHPPYPLGKAAKHCTK